MSKSFVYFIGDSNSAGPIKIGVAANVEARLKSLQTGNPNPLLILGIIEGGHKVEQALHKKFEKFRHHGEWFNPTEEIITYIAENTADPEKYQAVHGDRRLAQVSKDILLLKEALKREQEKIAKSSSEVGRVIENYRSALEEALIYFRSVSDIFNHVCRKAGLDRSNSVDVDGFQHNLVSALRTLSSMSSVKVLSALNEESFQLKTEDIERKLKGER